MPAYNFKCSKCNQQQRRFFHTKEIHQLYDLGSGVHCPACGAPRMNYIKSNKTVNDLFEPGVQRHLPGKPYIDSVSRYFKFLKENKLVIKDGEDDLDPYNKDIANALPPAWSEDTIKDMVKEGVFRSDQGQLFKYLLSGQADEDAFT